MPKVTPPTPLKDRFWGFMHTHKSMRYLALWVAVFLPLVSVLFKMVLDNYNYTEIFPDRLIMPLIMHAFTALWISAVVFFAAWPRSFAGKVVSAALLGMLFANYDDRLSNAAPAIKAILPILPGGKGEMAFVSVVLITTLVVLALLAGRGVEWLIKKQPKVEARNVTLGVYIVLAVVFSGQAFGMLSVLPSMIVQSNVTAPDVPKPADAKPPKDKPDIYYIVLDRYTNGEQLNEQIGFDNADFLNFLDDQQFTVNKGAYSNYSYTTASVASTLSAQYTNSLVAPFKDGDIHTRTLYHNIIHNAPVAKAMKEAGYEYHLVGSTYGATNSSAVADTNHVPNHLLRIFGQGKWLRGLEETAFFQSPYRRFTDVPIPGWPFNLETHEHAGFVRDQLTTLDRLASSKKQGGRFIMAHILVPHNPYIFNADGTVHPDTDVESHMPVKEKYKNQVQFINSQMKQLVSLIKEKSGGKAAIIFNSDEGEYPMYFETTFKDPKNVSVVNSEGAVRRDMRSWPDKWLKMKYGILQATYLPGVPAEELQHISSVNLFRVVLNNYFGYKLDYLPSCHFALTVGAQREFKYADISDRFYGQANPACRQFESR